jgi:type I restriction enzyme S subunit
MSKLEELIAEFCPNGVKYLPIKKCVNKVEKIKWSNTNGEKYQYIDLASVDRDTHLISETQFINMENAPSRAQQILKAGDVLLGATRPMLKRYCMIDEEFDKQICSTGFCVLRAKDDVVFKRWLYHVISSTNFFDHIVKFQKGASYPAISDADVKAFMIPVPPLPVQQEIVRILDNFTELTARKKQYEYYRDELLTFGDDVPRVKLVDVADISRGVRVVKKQLIHDGMYPVYQNSLAPMGYYDKYNCDANTTYVISAGAAGEIGFCDKGFWAADDCLVFSNLNGFINKYIYYFLMTKQDFIRSNVRKASIPRLSRTVIENLQIPLLSLEEQERIVKILDRFDTLTNDLASGLPAEIEARRKQYEYYRDKLLTFKEVGA